MFGHKKDAVVVRTFKNNEEFEKEASKLVEQGYEMNAPLTEKGKVNVGRTAGKLVAGNLLLPGVGTVWALGRPSRKEETKTVIFEKKPAPKKK